MEDTNEPMEITALIDHDVYSSNGTFIGQVDDLQLDLDAEAVTGLAVGGVNEEVFSRYARNGQGIVLPYRWVRSADDIVIVNDIVERYNPGEEKEIVE